MGLLFKNTAAALEKTEADLAATELRLAALAQEREAAIAAGDIEQTFAVDHSAELARRRLILLQDKVALLQDRIAAEERAAAAARRAAAVKQVEAMLPERAKIVGEIETAVKSIPELFAKLQNWRARFIERYPADVERPYEFFISTDRVLERVTAALRAIRAEDVGDAIDGLADDEARQHAALIEDLQQTPAPEQSEAA